MNRLTDSPMHLRLVAGCAVGLILAAAPFARATPPRPDGTIPPELRQAFASGLLRVPDHSALSTSSSQTDWLVPIIRVSFADSTIQYPASTFQYAMFDTTHSTATGSIVDYWSWASGNRIHVRGEVVATVTLPHPCSYYTWNSYGVNSLATPNNDAGMVQDAIAACDPSVDWSRYDRNGDGFVDMLWIVHAGLGAEMTSRSTNFWSLTSSLSGGWSGTVSYQTNDPVPGSSTSKIHIDRFTILPEISGFVPGGMSEIGVYCHEFGHALGLPDLYDTNALGGTSFSGPGQWSLMSTGAYGGDAHSPSSPSGLGAWPLLYLQFTSPVIPTQDTLVTMTPLSSGGPVFEYCFQGEYYPEHFLVEARYREGFDSHLPNDGILITMVDDAIIGGSLASNRINAGPSPGLRVLEADDRFDLVSGYDHGDPGDPLPGSLNVVHLDDNTLPSLRMMSGAVTNLYLDGVSRAGPATQVDLHVRAAAWQPIDDATETGYNPTTGSSRAHHAVVSPTGDEYESFSDRRSGVSQILLRTRSFAGSWTPSQQVSSSSVGAYDPGLARRSNGDLALVWSDLRIGASQIYYRSRINGVWGPETRISANGGITPAVSIDSQGRVSVVWIE
ncbi:MAG TPA: M6 family metalloprotease domain-containing protein, partial [Polyangiaceae bacterium]|nr:M6 family metalloprotease domain-containing protein [Polyangiaceae bacterium]